jgi:uncharacterized membrane protein
MVSEMLLFGIGIVVLATVIGSLGALSLKYASKRMEQGLMSLLKTPALYMGLLLYGVSALIFVFALKFGDLSLLYPIGALNYVWVTVLSMRFLKEKINDVAWFGMGLLVIGVVLIGFGA